MFGRKKKQKEPLPWYRERNYKGNLTEDEKRELDFFRHREKSQGIKHPAASYDDLPEEVGSYIAKLQIENYDHTQERLVGRCFIGSAIGALILASYFGWVPQRDSTLMFIYGAVLLVAPWIYYPIKWRRNADEFSDRGGEAIRKEWELDYIVNKEMKRTRGA